MPKALFTIFFLIFSFNFLYAKSVSINYVLKQLHLKYDNVTTFQADFKQISFFKGINQVQEFYGKVFLKKPDKMRWDYTKPEVQSIISNGRRIWYFYPDENQVNYADLKGKTKENDLIFMMLEGIKKIEEAFNMKLIKGNENSKYFYLQLIPEKPNTKITKIILTISKKDFSIVVSHVFYITGDISKVIFKNSKLNLNIKDEMFNFKPFPGCEVFKIPTYQ